MPTLLAGPRSGWTRWFWRSSRPRGTGGAETELSKDGLRREEWGRCPAAPGKDERGERGSAELAVRRPAPELEDPPQAVPQGSPAVGVGRRGAEPEVEVGRAIEVAQRLLEEEDRAARRAYEAQ